MRKLLVSKCKTLAQSCRNSSILFLGTILMVGCSDGSRDEATNHPFYVRGRKLLREQKYEKARQAFKKCLRVAPGCREAHLQLGLICQDYQQNPCAAVYHYQAYLRSTAESDPKRRAVREWIAAAQDAYLKQIAETDPGRSLRLLKEALPSSMLGRDTASRERARSDGGITERERRLARQVKTLNTRLLEVKRKLAASESRVAADFSGEGQRPTRTGAAPEGVDRDVGDDPSATTYTVKRGDTLYGICVEEYGEGGLWKQLQKYNESQLEGGRELLPGMVLEIPSAGKLEKLRERLVQRRGEDR